MKTINEYFSQYEKISSIDEYLLGKSKQKAMIINHPIISMFDEDIVKYVSEVNEEGDYVVINFHDLKWNMYFTQGISYIYDIKFHKVYLTTENPEMERKHNWWLQNTLSYNCILADASVFIQNNLKDKMKKGEIRPC